MVARQKLQKQALQDQCYVWRTLKKKNKIQDPVQSSNETDRQTWPVTIPPGLSGNGGTETHLKSCQMWENLDGFCFLTMVRARSTQPAAKCPHSDSMELAKYFFKRLHEVR
jgi:hypothetical protein